MQQILTSENIECLNHSRNVNLKKIIIINKLIDIIISAYNLGPELIVGFVQLVNVR